MDHNICLYFIKSLLYSWLIKHLVEFRWVRISFRLFRFLTLKFTCTGLYIVSYDSLYKTSSRKNLKPKKSRNVHCSETRTRLCNIAAEFHILASSIRYTGSQGGLSQREAKILIDNFDSKCSWDSNLVWLCMIPVEKLPL